MKRFIPLLYVLFSIIACQSEIEQDDNITPNANVKTNENAIPMSFYAVIEIPKDSSLTKTVLGGSPSDPFRNVLWEYEDEVYVTNGLQSSKFVNVNHTLPRKVYEGTYVGKLHTIDGRTFDMPELSYKPASDGGYWDVVETVIWENPDPEGIGSVSWSGQYRFGLEGTDGYNECVATFPAETWDIIKNGTFYLKFAPAADAYQIRANTGWWSFDGDGAYDIHKGDERIIDNGDGTFSLAYTLSEEPLKSGILGLIDEQHLLFTGIDYTLLKLYYTEEVWVPGESVEIFKSEIAFLEGELSQANNYFAAYPYKLVTESSTSSFTVDLPSEQTYYENGIASDAFPMVAQCEDGVFNFKNLCGIFVVQLRGNRSVSSITFSGKDSDGKSIPVAGRGVVSMNYSDTPSLIMSSSSSTQQVTLKCIDNIQLDDSSPTAFHIILPAGVYDTFKIVITAYDGSKMILNSNKALTIKRSTRTTAVALDFSPEFANYIDEYGINQGPGIGIDGVVWAPVNCGYHATDFKYGKLYQWGRKYGQGYCGPIDDMNSNNLGAYSDSTVPTIKSGPVSLSTGQSKSNDKCFYMVTSSPFDWLSSPDDELWNSGTGSNPVKTEYDPCPDGWRVPTYTELENLSLNKSSCTIKDDQVGYWLSGSESYSSSVPRVFFPAAGRRFANGSAYRRGLTGDYWSSGPYDDSAYYLFFDKYDVGMNDSDRADGFSVRCVQE